MNIVRVGVDIAKSVFHFHGVDRYGKTGAVAKTTLYVILSCFSNEKNV